MKKSNFSKTQTITINFELNTYTDNIKIVIYTAITYLVENIETFICSVTSDIGASNPISEPNCFCRN